MTSTISFQRTSVVMVIDKIIRMTQKCPISWYKLTLGISSGIVSLTCGFLCSSFKVFADVHVIKHIIIKFCFFTLFTFTFSKLIPTIAFAKKRPKKRKADKRKTFLCLSITYTPFALVFTALAKVVQDILSEHLSASPTTKI